MILNLLKDNFYKSDTKGSRMSHLSTNQTTHSHKSVNRPFELI